MVTKIDEQTMEKILAELGKEALEKLKDDRCYYCKRFQGQDCSYGLLPVTSSGDFCPYYMV